MQNPCVLAAQRPPSLAFAAFAPTAVAQRREGFYLPKCRRWVARAALLRSRRSLDLG